MFKVYETELAGRKLTIETGKFANQANGSVTVRYGDTVVMTNVTASKEPRDGVDFFPLSVDYEEKLYAVGRIPGSFNRREGKPADKAILISRAIDRPIRPLFPHDFRNDVCVVNTVLSMDQDCSPEVCANIGTSAALSISDIPWAGPTAAVQVGYVNDEIIINPTEAQRKNNRLRLTVAGTEEKITMIEAGADEIPNDIMLEAIKKAHVEIKKLCGFIKNIKDEIGKPKFEYQSFSVTPEFYKAVCDKFEQAMYEGVQEQNKEIRNDNVDKIAEEIKKLCHFIKNIKDEIGKPKFEYQSFSITTEFYKAVCDKFEQAMYEGVQEQNKEIRNDNVDKIAEQIKDLAIEMYGENAEEEHAFDIATSVHDLEKACVRKMILK